MTAGLQPESLVMQAICSRIIPYRGSSMDTLAAFCYAPCALILVDTACFDATAKGQRLLQQSKAGLQSHNSVHQVKCKQSGICNMHNTSVCSHVVASTSSTTAVCLVHMHTSPIRRQIHLLGLALEFGLHIISDIPPNGISCLRSQALLLHHLPPYFFPRLLI